MWTEALSGLIRPYIQRHDGFRVAGAKAIWCNVNEALVLAMHVHTSARHYTEWVNITWLKWDNLQSGVIFLGGKRGKKGKKDRPDRRLGMRKQNIQI